MVSGDPNPPFLRTYKLLIDDRGPPPPPPLPPPPPEKDAVIDLPLIELSRLILEPEECKAEIRLAAAEWGFFQVVGHGVPPELLDRLRKVQANLFRQPFAEKEKGKLLDFAAGYCYTWGTPTATSLSQLSWSEAYHIPMTPSAAPTKLRARRVIDEYATRVAQLSYELAGILAEGFEGKEGRRNIDYIEEHCKPSSCYLRLNRYPPCPIPKGVFGLVPHTDTDFLTIVYQDQVGGLQLLKGGRWITVKPNSSALIVNIGDLFQAWSNDVYRSVRHRVMANLEIERFSIAFQLCPSYETIIHSKKSPSIYRSFTFMEYKQQIKEDVKLFGHKIGLSRFLA
ncbi:gibberellin 2-beta-dioxygenase 8-like [Dendrobium catenatum]|uniref:Gibberellin 2-beta-dioxygenase 8 n=1 Tax=Dendrobium catenatum TaxID=906689 RepID=A0A2I0W1T3_9ASPA|nr:gibberellin 2-beta-dioxygenase 8-like [Dendrobium catenatum]PKU69620.1 Gibberellin 2-beta-dioxygenase 8 [Dendrobium catenatum]